VISLTDVRRLHLADVTLPGSDDVCPVFGFAITHEDGVVIVDTGIGDGHPGIDALYRPRRRPLIQQLSALKIAPTDVSAIINTHLHFDHCGDNRLFPGTPILVQRAEYEAAQEPAYTVPDWVTFPDACFQLLDGETEVLPDLTIVPTPGHTPGHQSVVLNTNEGLMTIAGQAAYTANEFARPQEPHPRGLDGAWDREKCLESLRRLRDLGARRVFFSHDAAVWEPS